MESREPLSISLHARLTQKNKKSAQTRVWHANKRHTTGTGKREARVYMPGTINRYTSNCKKKQMTRVTRAPIAPRRKSKTVSLNPLLQLTGTHAPIAPLYHLHIHTHIHKYRHTHTTQSHGHRNRPSVTHAHIAPFNGAGKIPIAGKMLSECLPSTHNPHAVRQRPL
jgi:hypothetical protein